MVYQLILLSFLFDLIAFGVLIILLTRFSALHKEWTLLDAKLSEILRGYEETEEYDSVDENEMIKQEEMTPYELKTQQREMEFDNRIERIKEELAEKSGKHLEDADVLHPGVENLPHNEINTYQPNPDKDEVAE